MQKNTTCPRCGGNLPPDAPEGNCPACLVGLALSAPEGESAQDPPEAARRHIGHSVIHKQLGEGGIGVVWLGHDESLNRWEAIKVLKPAYQNQADLVERLRQEAQFLAQLNHPNIVTVYRLGADAGQFFIAMEYLPGGSLEDELHRRGKLDWREATLAIRDAVCGLDAAHKAGVIHRDIKPGNLFRTEVGLTKIGDFGMARLKASTSIVTQPGQLVGTPSYIAPEQIPMGSAREAAKKVASVDPRTDLYSLICTYYALLTGHPPFEAPGESPARDVVLFRHLHEPFPDPGNDTPMLPKGVAAILRRGSQKGPAARYQNALELKQDLDAVLSGAEPTGATALPASGVGAGRRLPERAAKWCVAAALVLVLAVLASIGRKPAVDKANRPGRAELDEATFVERPIQWTEPGEKELVEGRTARAKTLETLKSFSWELIAGKFFPDEMGELETWVESHFELPERFILTGTLATVRVVEGKTWVGVNFGGKTFTALVVFDRTAVAEQMVDYRVGDAIRIVVARSILGKSLVRGGLEGTSLQQIAGVEGVAIVTRALHQHTECFYRFTDGGSCLCFKGEAMEKAGEPLSWIDANLGRTQKPANLSELLVSPGLIFRDLPDWLGRRGVIRGNYLRAQAGPEGLIVFLAVTNSVEGPLYLQLDLGKQARLDEFTDYARGDWVTAEVFLRGGKVNETDFWGPEWTRPVLQLASAPKQMAGEWGRHIFTNACSNPLAAWNGIVADCSRLQKPGQPATLVNASGPRRHPGPWVAPKLSATNSALPAPPGEETLVTGTLTMLFAMQGEAHCVVATEQPQSGAVLFEACTRQPGFMEATIDYLSSQERRRNGDIVTVRGSLWPSERPAFRLAAEAVLLELLEIERVGVASSRVVVGKPRVSETIETNRAPSSLKQLLRNIPPPGTEVRFSGFFYDVCYDGRVTIGPGEGVAYRPLSSSRPVVPLRFPNVPISAWSDYEDSEAPVEVVAIVRPPVLPVPKLEGKRTSRDARVVFSKAGAVPELEGISVARRKNPRSMVTAQGRPIGPTDVAEDEKKWLRLCAPGGATGPEKVRIEARFRGFQKSGSSFSVRFDHLFRGFNSLELTCTNLPPAAERFLYELEAGEDVVFEVMYDKWPSPAPTIMPKKDLLWLARLGDPDNRVTVTSGQ